MPLMLLCDPSLRFGLVRSENCVGLDEFHDSFLKIPLKI